MKQSPVSRSAEHTANQHTPKGGLSLPAVNPLKQSEKEVTESPEGEMAAEYEGKVSPSLQLKPVSTLSKPAVDVVQREAITKEGIFIDQIKWVVVQGIANYCHEDTGSADAKKLFVLLADSKIINIDDLKKYQGKKINQTQFFEKEKQGLLGGITLNALQHKALVMDAVSAVDVVKGKWDIYKTEIKESVHGSATAEGFGGKKEGTQDNVKTRVEWGAAENKQGKSMEAKVLAADHPLGSAPNKIGAEVYNLSEAADGEPYIAGHLLNNNLGGPGDDIRNLTAIPADVNSEMSSKVENAVIRRVNKNHEVVYYKVDVTYKNEDNLPYASQLSIRFGSYKPDTDFSKADPGKDLADEYTYTIPINAPSVYKTKRGYNKKPGENFYTDSKKNQYPLPDIKESGANKTFEFDSKKNTVLKNPTQIRLEFISYAIYALEIKEQEEKVKELTEEKKESIAKIKDLEVEQEELQKELEQKSILMDKLQNDLNELSEEIAKAEVENKDLKEENWETKEKLLRLGIKLKSQKEKIQALKKDLKEYMEKARARADALGFEKGLEDGSGGLKNLSEERMKSTRMSLGSADPFKNGYARGYAAGKERKEKEDAKENELRELKEENKAKDEIINGQKEIIKDKDDTIEAKSQKIDELERVIAEMKKQLAIQSESGKQKDKTELVLNEPMSEQKDDKEETQVKEGDEKIGLENIKEILPQTYKPGTPAIPLFVDGVVKKKFESLKALIEHFETKGVKNKNCWAYVDCDKLRNLLKN